MLGMCNWKGQKEFGLGCTTKAELMVRVVTDDFRIKEDRVLLETLVMYRLYQYSIQTI